MKKIKCRSCPDRRYDLHDLIAERDLLKKKLERAMKVLDECRFICPVKCMCEICKEIRAIKRMK